MKYRCPICRKITKISSLKQSEDTKFFPFCSSRCKLMDLGAWLDAEYKITSEPQPPPASKTPDASSDVPG